MPRFSVNTNMGWWKKPASDTQVTHGDRLWLYVVAAIIMLLLVIPTFIVIPMSFSDSQYLEFPPDNWSVRWYTVYLESSKWMPKERPCGVLRTKTSARAFSTMLVVRKGYPMATL